MQKNHNIFPIVFVNRNVIVVYKGTFPCFLQYVLILECGGNNLQ